MRTLAATAATVVLASALTACGTSADDASSGTPSGNGQLFGGCAADSAAVKQARLLTRADLDGDGEPDAVRFTGPQAGRCANAVLAHVGGRTIAARVGEPLRGGHARTVQLNGKARQLVFFEGHGHPRGGFQPHIVGLGGNGLAEVKAHGKPLLGFMSTDGGGLPETATCTKGGGIAVLSATTHKPPGVVLAWDVRKTTYSLDGTVAKRTTSRQIRDAAADPTLHKRMPQLFDPSGYFAGCS
jgi:hypothetical protein